MALRESQQQDIPKSTLEALDAAEEAGLRYVNDKGAGFTRKPLKKGFRYLDQNGKPIGDPRHLNRIKLLVIPPAWTNVWICPFANGHIQVTGRDQKGRKQYLYHEDWRKARDLNKYEKMIHFGQKLPALRKRIQSDLRKRGMPREKVLAAIVSVMDRTLIRVGNDEYAKTNKSYGLTTIRNGHVKVKGHSVIFRFKGKSGIEHDIEMSDPRIARIVRQCQELPGQELFAYVDDDGKVCDVTSNDVNAYLKETLAEDFTAKDFRTWGGSVRALRCFLNLGGCDEPLTKAMINGAYKETAKFLGNTVTVCKKYYIHPAVVENFEAGLLGKMKRSSGEPPKTGLSPDEKLFLKLLKK
jgi:DNA topoisomerase-1